MPTWSPFKLTAMHHQHLRLGATMVDHVGWQRPAHYTSREEELQNIRNTGGICDTSPAGKFYIQGDDVGTLLENVFPEAASLGINRSTISNLGSTKGGLLISRFSHDEVFITCSPDDTGLNSQVLRGNLNGCLHFVDMTSTYAAVTVVGPKSAQLLSQLTDLNISPSAFLDLSCAQGQLAEVYTIIVRSDQAGLPSYNVYVGRDLSEYVWEVMLEAGHGLGIVPVGFESLKQLDSGA